MFLWFSAHPASAQSTDPECGPGGVACEEIEVVGTLDPAAGSASVTVIPVDERLPASADLAGVVGLAPGAVVRRLGGVGAFSTVSIRGSTSRQVEVLLDGVPLNPDGTATVDLAELPLSALARVEVYRGSAPLELGATAIGGVVNLVTADRPARSVMFGLGTLGVARGSAAWSGTSGRWDGLVVADGLGAQNAYRWFDDAGTVFVADDDRFRERENADRRQGTLHARARWGDDDLRVTLLTAGLAREEGVPGFTFAPTSQVRYAVWRDLSSVQVEAQGDVARVVASGWVQVRREQLDDALGEIGVGAQRTDERSLSPGGRVTAVAALGSALSATALFEGRGDRWVSRDALGGSVADPIDRGRVVGRVGLGATWELGPAALTPAVLGTLLDAEGDRTGSVDPRLGARVELTRRLAWTGNLGRYLRPPDLTELYGDRGALVGNPDLRPERGLQADLGLRWVDDHVRAELVGFQSAVADRIVWVQNAQQVAMPVNLDDSVARGVEGAVSATTSAVEGWVALTRTWSRQRSDEAVYDGNELPRIPAWELEVRLAATGAAWRGGWTFSQTSPTWYDAANFYRSAPRSIHGVFARVTEGPMSLEAEILNLADRLVEEVPANPLVEDGATTLQPLTDFVGMPLPGRTFLLTARWTP